MLQPLNRASQFFALLLLVASIPSLQAADASAGKTVFKTQCASCHNMEVNMTGPALDGAFSRIQDFYGFSDEETHDWLVNWIKNSPSVIASGDEYANKIFQENGGKAMTAFSSLPDADIDNVIEYIKTWEPAVADVATTEGGAGGGGANIELILLILVIALLIIALVLARVTNVLGRISAEREGEKVAPEKPFYQNKKFQMLVVIVACIGVFMFLSNAAIQLGRQQDYQPTQPIAFSHQLHATGNKIDCQYCHVGVDDGKAAGIPTVNICMNCHKVVHQGPTGDTTEIAKIHAAAGYDKQTQTFDPDKAKPIEWVRIHNLPDHVYFNHSQHVVAGGIACQTCHGPIQEMDEVKQFAPLSMGWCISCHRETNVNMLNNDYYATHYKEWHKDLENKTIDGVTVEMIGGTECQKCHY